MNRARKLPVTSDAFKVNSQRRRIVARALRYVTAEMARGAPAKEIAAETGIAVSEVYEYRTARRKPNIDAWYALLQRRPDLKPLVDRITTGQATSEEINRIVLMFQRGGG